MKTGFERIDQTARRQLQSLFDDCLNHPGYADLRVEMRLLKRGQKEVIIYCGKQYRYVIDVPSNAKPADDTSMTNPDE